jgi:hypothetical protein
MVEQFKGNKFGKPFLNMTWKSAVQAGTTVSHSTLVKIGECRAAVKIPNMRN